MRAQPQRGDRKGPESPWPRGILSPLRGSPSRLVPPPTAYAVGYDLSPPRGWERNASLNLTPMPVSRVPPAGRSPRRHPSGLGASASPAGEGPSPVARAPGPEPRGGKSPARLQSTGRARVTRRVRSPESEVRRGTGGGGPLACHQRAAHTPPYRLSVAPGEMMNQFADFENCD